MLNAGFFATPNGLRIMEFNARFGDPECMNIMCLLRTPFLEICRQVVERRLDSSAEHFAGEASVVKYLVSPDYPTGSAREHRFNMDVAAIEAKGLHVFFASSESDGVGYKTVGASRCVAVAAMAPSLQAASDLVEEAIHGNVRGALHHRKDIGDQAYIQRQARRRKLLTTDSPADDR